MSAISWTSKKSFIVWNVALLRIQSHGWSLVLLFCKDIERIYSFLIFAVERRSQEAGSEHGTIPSPTLLHPRLRAVNEPR